MKLITPPKQMKVGIRYMGVDLHDNLSCFGLSKIDVYISYTYFLYIHFFDCLSPSKWRSMVNVPFVFPSSREQWSEMA